MPSRARILVVEDDVLLSMDVEAILVDSGFEGRVVGSMVEALRAVKDRAVDGAVIDLNLKGNPSFPVADALSEADIPFLVLTGHSRDFLPPRHRDRPFLQKPYKSAQLAQAVRAMMADADHTAQNASCEQKSA